LLLRSMVLGETAELMCTPEMVCGPSAVRIVATLSSWIRIDEVRNTGGQVLKRELHVPEVNLATPPHGPSMPNPEATCRVRYSCVAVGGGPEGDQRTMLDEVGMGGDALGEPAQFVQGDRELLPCIEMAVLDMMVGEKARLYAPASWAFDAPGFPHAVEVAPQMRGQEVEVEVELVGMDNAADTNGMAMDLKMEVHVRRKEAGNRLFTKGALHEAVAKWELAAGTLPDGVSVIRYDLSRGGQRTEQQLADDLASCRKVQLSTQLNMANAQLKLGEPLLAFTAADKALTIDEGNVKALFRRAQARLAGSHLPIDVELVRADLTRAVKLDPTSREIRAELEKLKAVDCAQKAKEKGLFGGMFSRPGAEVKDEPPPKTIYNASMAFASSGKFD